DLVRPAGGKTGVVRNTNVTATFSEGMKNTTIKESTFKLFKVNADRSTTQITNVVVTPSSDGLEAVLNPFGNSSTLLAKNTKYRAVVTVGAKDLAGNSLDQDRVTSGSQPKVWTFKTGSS
nr:Ig-like domain-containing protein [Rubrobacter sp.]